MKKFGFTLVEISVTALIISIISLTLVVVLRGNLNTVKVGQKNMDLNQKALLAMKRIFYDLKKINPILINSETYGYIIKGENSGEPKPRKIIIRNTLRKSIEDYEQSGKKNYPRDELEFVLDSDQDVEDIYAITYFLKNDTLIREVRDKNNKKSYEKVLEDAVSFEVYNDSIDVKQIYIKFSTKEEDKDKDKDKNKDKNKDKDKKIKIARTVDFAVRLETDFVYVDKQMVTEPYENMVPDIK